MSEYQAYNNIVTGSVFVICYYKSNSRFYLLINIYDVKLFFLSGFVLFRSADIQLLSHYLNLGCNVKG